MGVLHVRVDVEAGDPEVHVIYISFIVSVQNIGYLGITWITWTIDSRCTVVPDMIIWTGGYEVIPLGNNTCQC